MAPAPDPLSLAALEAGDPRAKTGGAERDFCCPLCGGDKRQDAAHRSLSVNTTSGAWKCHRCGAAGKLREWWTERDATEYRPGVRMKARGAALRRRSALPPAPPPPAAQDLGDALLLPTGTGGRRFPVLPLSQADGDSRAGGAGSHYLIGRGVGPELAAASGVTFSRDWYGRPAVVFPLHDKAGRLTAAQGRFTDGREGLKTQSAGPISAGVFATAGAWKADTLLLTEAPLDALSLAVCGLPALATCGSTIMAAWVPARCAFRRVLLAFDADPGGDAAAAAWTALLAPLRADVGHLRPEGGKDWNELLTTRGRAWLEDWLTGAGALRPTLPAGGMRLSEFAVSRRVVRVRSDVLGENVFFAADNADVSGLPAGLAVYRARELARLMADGPAPDALRLWHAVKTRFDAPLDAWEVEEARDAGAEAGGGAGEDFRGGEEDFAARAFRTAFGGRLRA